jgi:lipid A ethanolaminephosphotransferase
MQLLQFPFTASRLCLLVAAWIVLTANHAFWRLFVGVNGTNARALLFAAGVAVSLLALNVAILRLLSPGRSLRLMLSVLVVLAVVTSWFMDTYGVAIDREMLRNVVQTNVHEASDFIGWPLLWRLCWQAGLPLLLIWNVTLPVTGWLKSLWQYLLTGMVALVAVFVVALPQYVSYASFFRNQPDSYMLLAPGNVIAAAIKLVKNNLNARRPFVIVGADARRGPEAHDKPLLTLLVVGETARAANFSLGGYARVTNPLLQKRAVLYFSNVRSCGTATAMSVPCMFSDLPRAEFDVNGADHRDTVLDILQRAGVTVTWLDNQADCKGVCARVPMESAGQYDPSSCAKGECLDETLLHALDSKLPTIKTDRLLVMHQMGSHGPSYYRRVPPGRVTFQPTCATERIEKCTSEQIVNAYDNSIAYTDYILDGLIARLQRQQEQLDSVLIYVSDHGESLGENGLYLHGHPYAIAPEAQKHVPMIIWYSNGVAARLGLDTHCLRGRLAEAFSHDNLSHTLLGLSDVITSTYRPQLDILRGCRHATAPRSDVLATR